MATLVWDKVGERVYQAGVDRGVLYLHDGAAVVWNGLTGIEESPNSELKSYYLDGVKYLENLTPADFLGKLKAFTYPDEFDSLNGIATVAPGFSLHEQPSKSFSLSYRTKIGNDVDDLDYGYKIHILYNVIASPENYEFPTNSEKVDPIEFSWNLTGTPPRIVGYRPAVHVSIDSIRTSSKVLTKLENTLYGSRKTVPTLPSIQDLAVLLGGVLT